MSATKFVRSFVLLTAKDLGPPKTMKLKDLYVGQKYGKLVKPWVEAPASNKATASPFGNFAHMNLQPSCWSSSTTCGL
jgi:hypothetical protein